MKPGKRTTAIALGILLAVSMTACGGTGETAGDIPTALEKINAVKSLDATMVMEMDMSIMDQSMETETTMNMSCFNDPMKLKADMTMDMGQLGSMNTSMYAAMDGDNYTVYLYDGTAWTTQTVDVSALQQYDAQESMNLYLESADDYTQDGTEEINGSTANKFTGVIRGEALEEVLAASGATNNLEASVGDLDLASLYSDLGDLEITVWVDQESGYPVRYAMDMTEMMQGIMERAMAASGSETDTSGMVTIDKVTMVMDCFNFDNVADFEIPAEALAA
ncbi:DUF6612 family protein [Intestinimonas massiliensis (ex Afouda et al. 2020)]|uniref:DUF6612 family protein n=1 Tax=Intestinimonas massiliensis (ex Afouda et al. 2020) TaxID=1673721 RepID=UPI00102FDF94|nr:DUF6612 family protein [Intestinimonas massiliensis (ex Afouda et al. 2020)]